MPKETLSRKMLNAGTVPLSETPQYDEDYARERMEAFLKNRRRRTYPDNVKHAAADQGEPVPKP